jgi:hypothetical protein
MSKDNLVSLDEARRLFAVEPVPEPEPEPTPKPPDLLLRAAVETITVRVVPMMIKGTIDGIELVRGGGVAEAISSFQEEALTELRDLYHKGEIVAHGKFEVERDRDVYKHQELVVIKFNVAKPPAEGEPGHGIDLSGRAQEIVRLMDANPELQEIRLRDYRQSLRPTVRGFGAEYQQDPGPHPGREFEMMEGGERPHQRFDRTRASGVHPSMLCWDEPKPAPRKGDIWMNRRGETVEVRDLIRSMRPGDTTVMVRPEKFNSHASPVNLVDFQRDYALCYREQAPTFTL